MDFLVQGLATIEETVGIAVTRPEVYTFKQGDKVYVVESAGGGFLGHSHKLVRAYPTAKPGAILYFTMKAEYLHSHDDEKHLYYIGTDNKIHDYATGNVTKCSTFTGMHFHLLKLREVIQMDAPITSKKHHNDSDSDSDESDDEDSDSDEESDSDDDEDSEDDESDSESDKDSDDESDSDEESDSDDDSESDSDSSDDEDKKKKKCCKKKHDKKKKKKHCHKKK